MSPSLNKDYCIVLYCNESSKHDISNCHFYKLPYIGFYSSYTRKKVSSIIGKYCKDLNVKIFFSPFKLCKIFIPKPKDVYCDIT